MKCSVCSTEKVIKGDRLPHGWKRVGESVTCEKCWKKDFVLRSITMVVAQPVDKAWKELREAVNKCWDESTQLANWAITQLASRDVIRRVGDRKCPAMPAIYLYGLAKQSYDRWNQWDGATSCAQSILHTVEQNYRKRRFDILWKRTASLAGYRYPYPYPIHNQSWTASFGKDNVPLVTLPLAGQRWTLRIKGGPEWHRQLKAFKQIVNGEAVQGEAAILGDNKCLKIKLVAWFPRAQTKLGEKLMILQTDPAAFIVAEIEGRAPFIINADHVRHHIECHRVFRQRMAEDLKFEKRWPSEKRAQMLHKLDLNCQKQRNRVQSFVHEASACIAQYAQRNQVGNVMFDNSIKTYLPKFPWFNFEQKLSYKLDALGIQLNIVNKSSQEENSDFMEKTA